MSSSKSKTLLEKTAPIEKTQVHSLKSDAPKSAKRTDRPKSVKELHTLTVKSEPKRPLSPTPPTSSPAASVKSATAISQTSPNAVPGKSEVPKIVVSKSTTADLKSASTKSLPTKIEAKVDSKISKSSPVRKVAFTGSTTKTYELGTAAVLQTIPAPKIAVSPRASLTQTSTKASSATQLAARPATPSPTPSSPKPTVVLSPKVEALKKNLTLSCRWITMADDQMDQKKYDALLSKQNNLLDVQTYMIENPDVFPKECYKELIKMVASNLFRKLPSIEYPPAIGGWEPEEDEVEPPAEWPILKMVYDIFAQFLELTTLDTTMIRKFINQKFCSLLMDLFDSNIQIERDFVRFIVHRIYSRVADARLKKQIQQKTSDILLNYTYVEEKFLGICELLEFLATIIGGFHSPLKTAHKQLLIKVLLPLHKTRTLKRFHLPLSYCTQQMVLKDPPLAKDTIDCLKKYWPVQCGTKQMSFLVELQSIMSIVAPDVFDLIMVVAYKLLIRAFSSENSAIVIRALRVFKDEYQVELIRQHNEELIPIFLPIIFKQSENHWDSSVKQECDEIITNVIKPMNGSMTRKMLKQLKGGEEPETAPRSTKSKQEITKNEEKVETSSYVQPVHEPQSHHHQNKKQRLMTFFNKINPKKIFSKKK